MSKKTAAEPGRCSALVPADHMALLSCYCQHGHAIGSGCLGHGTPNCVRDDLLFDEDRGVVLSLPVSPAKRAER